MTFIVIVGLIVAWIWSRDVVRRGFVVVDGGGLAVADSCLYTIPSTLFGILQLDEYHSNMQSYCCLCGSSG